MMEKVLEEVRICQISCDSLKESQKTNVKDMQQLIELVGEVKDLSGQPINPHFSREMIARARDQFGIDLEVDFVRTFFVCF